jgi:hypothetical protein
MLTIPIALAGVGKVGEYPLQIDSRLGREWKVVDDPVLEQQSEDRREEREERDERKEDVVRDRGGKLRAAVGAIFGVGGRRGPDESFERPSPYGI